MVQEAVNGMRTYNMYIYIFMSTCLFDPIKYEYPFLHIYVDTIPIPPYTYRMAH